MVRRTAWPFCTFAQGMKYLMHLLTMKKHNPTSQRKRITYVNAPSKWFFPPWRALGTSVRSCCLPAKIRSCQTLTWSCGSIFVIILSSRRLKVSTCRTYSWCAISLLMALCALITCCKERETALGESENCSACSQGFPFLSMCLLCNSVSILQKWKKPNPNSQENLKHKPTSTSENQTSTSSTDSGTV